MKPWQTPVNKAKGKKEGTKREDPSPDLKDKTQSESQRGKATNHVPKPPFLSQLKQNRK
jgi:hypothetical protein